MDDVSVSWSILSKTGSEEQKHEGEDEVSSLLSTFISVHFLSVTIASHLHLHLSSVCRRRVKSSVPKQLNVWTVSECLSRYSTMGSLFNIMN